MTLIAELTDSASGQVLARVADRREATNTRMQITNGMINESEARWIAAAWAKTLRKALDNAQAIGAK
jgi:predicted NBD/HSP70 family sugar kinase